MKESKIENKKYSRDLKEAIKDVFKVFAKRYRKSKKYKTTGVK